MDCQMIGIVLTVAFGALLVHPFVTYPMGILLVRTLAGRREIAVSRPTEPFSIAICCCAYNEQAVIEEKVKNLLALKRRYRNLEIHMYVDGSSDRTAEILIPYREHINLVVSQQRRGKSEGMNTLVARTAADIIVFTDANVMMRADSLENVAKYFKDPDVGCVCGHLQYTNASASGTASTGAAYWRFEEWLKQIETDTGSTISADGSLFAIRRELHIRVPEDIIDDMFLSLNVLFAGFRVVRGADVVAYERGATSGKEEFQRKVRIACQAFNIHRRLWHRLKRLSWWNLYKYVSHKLLRWFGLCSFAGMMAGIVLLAFSLGVGRELLAIGLFVTSILLFGAAVEQRFAVRVVTVSAAFLATGLGIYQSLRGRRFRTWTPATSVRA